MGLEGSFDTFSVADVLGLLARTAQHGRLDATVGTGLASLWFDGGTIVAAELPAIGPCDPAEAVFEAWRHDGDFRFQPGGAAPSRPTVDGDVFDVLRRVERLAAEWNDLVAEVPSGGTVLALRPDVVRSEVVLDADRWQVVRHVGERLTVAELGECLGLGDVAVRRLAADSLRAGIVRVVAPSQAGPDDGGSADAGDDAADLPGPLSGLSAAAARAIMALAPEEFVPDAKAVGAG